MSIYFNQESIFFINSSQQETSSQIPLSTSTDHIKNRKVILVAHSEAPKVSLYFAANEHNAQVVKDFEKKGFVFVRLAISSVETLCTAIDKLKSQGNTIHGLWLRAHGSNNVISLGILDAERESAALFNDKEYYNIDQLGPSLEKLEHDAAIILESCSTGSKDKNGNCIAKSISGIAQRLVIAPQDSIKCLNLYLEDDEGLLGARFISDTKDITAKFDEWYVTVPDINPTERKENRLKFTIDFSESTAKSLLKKKAKLFTATLLSLSSILWLPSIAENLNSSYLTKTIILSAVFLNAIIHGSIFSNNYSIASTNLDRISAAVVESKKSLTALQEAKEEFFDALDDDPCEEFFDAI